ncbi:MAG: nitrous oxide reductase accessory protein NosL [Flavobacteriales bacterium]|nr:nitrous oxide reductase accessory protein NosL [Flavobacteriales bacterium]
MKKSRLLMILAALLPLLLFVLPMWRIMLEAPQYPEPIGFKIYINDFKDVSPNDMKNINILNHYVGMQYIPDAIPEFKIFPWGVLFTSVLGLILALIGKHKFYLYWFILVIGLSAAGVADFYIWEYNYGHNLDPKAIMKFTDENGNMLAYQPPVFGSKTILNFKAHSYPQLGTFFLILGIALSFVAYKVGKKEVQKSSNLGTTLLMLGFLTLSLSSCSTNPKEIDYGKAACSYCKMNIVDNRHAAEIVTKKGKVFMYDAIECMVHDKDNNVADNNAHTLVMDYNNPNHFVNALEASYLISENLPSPMNANLSAFSSQELAQKAQSEFAGTIYSWNELAGALNQNSH